jgi:hypothetical protein
MQMLRRVPLYRLRRHDVGSLDCDVAQKEVVQKEVVQKEVGLVSMGVEKEVGRERIIGSLMGPVTA